MDAARPVSRAVYAPPGRDSGRVALVPVTSLRGHPLTAAEGGHALVLVGSDGAVEKTLCMHGHTVSDLLEHWDHRSPRGMARGDASLARSSSELSGVDASTAGTPAAPVCRHTYDEHEVSAWRVRDGLAAAMYLDFFYSDNARIVMTREPEEPVDHPGHVDYEWSGARDMGSPDPVGQLEKSSGYFHLTEKSMLILVYHGGMSIKIDSRFSGTIRSFYERARRNAGKSGFPLTVDTRELLGALARAATQSPGSERDRSRHETIETTTHTLYSLMHWIVQDDIKGVTSHVAFSRDVHIPKHDTDRGIVTGVLSMHQVKEDGQTITHRDDSATVPYINAISDTLYTTLWNKLGDGQRVQTGSTVFKRMFYDKNNYVVTWFSNPTISTQWEELRQIHVACEVKRLYRDDGRVFLGYQMDVSSSRGVMFSHNRGVRRMILFIRAQGGIENVRQHLQEESVYYKVLERFETTVSAGEVVDYVSPEDFFNKPPTFTMEELKVTLDTLEKSTTFVVSSIYERF